MTTLTCLAPQDEARFWSHVARGDGNECWLWMGTVQHKYGIFGVHRRYMKAHRVSYEIAYGPIPCGMVIDHICHQESCVNPSHLRAATVKQNAENRLGANRLSKSGVRGVHWNTASKCWRVVVVHNGAHLSGGTFSNVAEAAEAAHKLRAKVFTHSVSDI